jgi:hypothetical protein
MFRGRLLSTPVCDMFLGYRNVDEAVLWLVKQAVVYLDTACIWPPGRSAAIWLIDIH